MTEQNKLTGQEWAKEALRIATEKLREQGAEISEEAVQKVAAALTEDANGYALTLSTITQLFAMRPDLAFSVNAIAKVITMSESHQVQPVIEGV